MPTNKKDYWSKDGGANYKKYHGSAKAKKERAERNRARASAVKKGRVKKGDGMEVDHKKPLSKGGAKKDSNTRIVKRKTNRVDGAKIANRNKKKKK